MIGWILLLVPMILIEMAFRSIRPVINYTKDPSNTTPEVLQRDDLNNWTRLKLYLGAYTLMPLRGLLSFVCVFGHWLTCRFVLFLHKDWSTPITSWKRSLVYYSSMFWARLLIFTVGVWNVKHEGESSPQACALVANHVSWIDILYFLIDPDLPSFLSKEAVKKWPFIGIISIAMQCTFVDRVAGRGQALKVLIERMKKIHAGERFPKCIIYPEGTTGNGKALMHFKKGAFAAKVPVQPVCLIYSGNISPAMEVIPLWVSAVFMMCQFKINLTVRRLDVCVPEEHWTTEEFAESVRNKMAKSMDIPLTDFTFEDKLKHLSKVYNITLIDL